MAAMDGGWRDLLLSLFVDSHSVRHLFHMSLISKVTGLLPMTASVPDGKRITGGPPRSKPRTGKTSLPECSVSEQIAAPPRSRERGHRGHLLWGGAYEDGKGFWQPSLHKSHHNLLRNRFILFRLLIE